MQVFTSELYREYQPNALERYDNAQNQLSETGDAPQITGEMFREVLAYIDENRRTFNESDQHDDQKNGNGEPYQDESREYTLQEQFNYKSEVKPQGVQQEILESTLETSDFSPTVTSSNNEAIGNEAANSSVVVEQRTLDNHDGFDGFSFGEVEASVLAEQAPSPADTMLGEIAMHQQAVPQGNPANVPT